MTYWPVAFFIVVGVIWLMANMLKSAPETLAKCAIGSYGVAAVLGGMMLGNEGAGPVLAITVILGTILLVISCAFCLFYEGA